MELRQLIKDYLGEANMLQVVTAKDNQPWAATVYFAYDANLNLYWISKPDRRHSIEIRENPKVAGVVVLPHVHGDKVRGLQLEGVAEEMESEGIDEGLKVYSERFWLPEERLKAILADTDGHRVYIIRPTLFVLFDEKNFPDNPRQEYNLSH